ncbi:MAG TPA: NAD(P)/FAD-dependent oxidoreductase [Polyangiaceae bacterium]|nr:NAD(P)/FAD-dependent oxidoreductase [Polyangiaceae bacterium]
MTTHSGERPRVVIIGGGFGGLTAARALKKANVQLTLVDRSNYHLFQPLLYQVAMAGLSPADIAAPIRTVLRRQDNTTVLLADVTRVDLQKKQIELETGAPLDYDYLVLAAGAQSAYFGHDDWRTCSLGMKSVDDAIEVRRRVLLAFEAAEREDDPVARRRLLTFVIIGGGPTGVEVAGALTELGKFALADDFRRIRSEKPRVVLVERANRLLTGGFVEQLSEAAKRDLEAIGVEVRVGETVVGIDEHGVRLAKEFIETPTVLWTAGVEAVPLTRTLHVPVDRTGRVIVGKDCSIPGHPESFVIGDAAAFTPPGTEHPLPGLSPVAMQQARFVAKVIKDRVDGRPPPVFFRYFDKGIMATIGRSRAVAQTGKLRLRGLIAWLAWLFVHIWYLIGFRNRLVVLFDWTWSYLTYKRGARLITGGAAPGRLLALAERAGRPMPRKTPSIPPPRGEPVTHHAGK